MVFWQGCDCSQRVQQLKALSLVKGDRHSRLDEEQSLVLHNQ
ncbi:MAG: hypothetical protein V7K92_12725 [Nostoc sp.]